MNLLKYMLGFVLLQQHLFQQFLKMIILESYKMTEVHVFNDR